jgi:hypothetical protein
MEVLISYHNGTGSRGWVMSEGYVDEAMSVDSGRSDTEIGWRMTHYAGTGERRNMQTTS